MYGIAWGLSVVVLGVFFQLWGLVYIAGIVTALLVVRQLISLIPALFAKEESKVRRPPRPVGHLSRTAEQRQRNAAKMR
jgi:hypothetical protein